MMNETSTSPALSGTGRAVGGDRRSLHEAVPLSQDPAEALKAAQEDLRIHLEAYIEEYRATKAQGRRGW